MNGELALWVEVTVATLLVLSGTLVVVAAVGFVRFDDFFVRMHPPTLAYTLGNWCVTAAGTFYVSMLESRIALHLVLIAVVLSMTVPVTTLLLARATLFRRRATADADVPPPLSQPRGP